LIRIKILDHNKYLTKYKLTSPGKYVIDLNESLDEHEGWFDQDDLIINICQQNFENVQIESSNNSVEEEMPKQENLNILDWI